MKISRRTWMAGVAAALFVRPVMANPCREMLTQRQYRAIRSWSSLPKLEVVYVNDPPPDFVFPYHTIGYTDAQGNIFRFPPTRHAVNVLARDYHKGVARVILDLYGVDVQYETKDRRECELLRESLVYVGVGYALDFESAYEWMNILHIVRISRSRCDRTRVSRQRSWRMGTRSLA